MVSLRAERASRAGTLISWARMVPVVGFGVEGRGEGAGGAGEVERHRGADQPGAVGGERPGRQVGQRAVLQVGDDLLDDRVGAVRGLRGRASAAGCR